MYSSTFRKSLAIKPLACPALSQHGAAQPAAAAKTAATDFNTASNKLSQAHASTKKTVVAMRLAEQAKADVDLAHAKADSMQAMAASEEIARSNQAWREDIKRAHKNQ